MSEDIVEISHSMSTAMSDQDQTADDLRTYLRSLLADKSQERLQRESPLFRNHWEKVQQFLSK